MNVDQHEINKFSDLEKEWWNPQGKCQPLHAINPLRLEFIQAHAELSQQKVLDVGCGGGILTEGMARCSANVVGIDMAAGAIAAAKAHQAISQLSIDYQLIAVETLASQQPASFDVITCMEMLEHVPDPFSIIQACTVLLKPGGKIFFSTINRNLKAYAYAIVGAEWVLQLLPKGTHDYAKFIRPSELSAWARQMNLMVNEFLGISYSPFTKKYQLNANVDVNYLMACEKPNA